MRKLLYILLALPIIALASQPTPTVVATTHQAALVSESTAPYHYFGPIAITTCQVHPPGYNCNSPGVWWKVTANIAGWQNIVNRVVLATGSGYPHCSASGWNITVEGCSYWYSGNSAYVQISWQNCIPPFGVGCWSDYAVIGFNNRGQYVYYHEAWADAYP